MAVTAGVAASLAFAAPATADDDDDAFLSALNQANIPLANDNADLTAQFGERVCPMLVEPGKNFASVASTVADNGISPGMASFFTGIAISMYCPQMMGSIVTGPSSTCCRTTRAVGNGRMAGVPGLSDCPAFAALGAKTRSALRAGRRKLTCGASQSDS